MKLNLSPFSRRYRAALQTFLKQSPGSPVRGAHKLAEEAGILMLSTTDLARIHQSSLEMLKAASDSKHRRKRKEEAGRVFYAQVASRAAEARRGNSLSAGKLQAQNKSLTRRSAHLSAANRRLKHGMLKQNAAGVELRHQAARSATLLVRAKRLQKKLRKTTRRMLSAQENIVTKISHDLNDDVAQTLLGIQVRLLTLKKGAAARGKYLAKEIASTRRLVEKSGRKLNRLAAALGPHHEA